MPEGIDDSVHCWSKPIKTAVDLIAKHNALADTMKRARHYGAIARDALAIFPDDDIKSALLGAIEFSVSRPF